MLPNLKPKLNLRFFRILAAIFASLTVAANQSVQIYQRIHPSIPFVESYQFPGEYDSNTEPFILPLEFPKVEDSGSELSDS